MRKRQQLLLCTIVFTLIADFLPSQAGEREHGNIREWKRLMAAAREAKEKNELDRAGEIYRDAVIEAEGFSNSDIKRLETWWKAGRFFQSLRDYSTAAELFKKGADAINGPRKEERISKAFFLTALGETYQFWDQNQAAEKALLEAKALLEQAVGGHDANLAPILSALGTVYLQEKRYGEAEQTLKTAVDLAENPSVHPFHNETMFGHYRTAADPFDAANAQSALGTLYLELKKYPEAEQSFSQSVHTIEQNFGKDSYNLSPYLRNLGITFFEAQNPAKAEEVFRREFAIEKKMPAGIVSYTQTTVLLVRVCLTGGKENEIGPLFQKLIQYNRTSAKSEDLLKVALLFVSNRFQKEPWEKIAPIYEAALAAGRNGLSSPKTILPSLAVIVQSALAHKEFSAAEHYAQSAIDLVQQSAGHKEIDLSGPIRDLMDVYKAEGKWTNAEALAARQTEIFEKAFGEGDSRVANAFDDYGACAAKAGHTEQSKRAKDKADDIRLKAYARKS